MSSPHSFLILELKYYHGGVRYTLCGLVLPVMDGVVRDVFKIIQRLDTSHDRKLLLLSHMETDGSAEVHLRQTKLFDFKIHAGGKADIL